MQVVWKEVVGTQPERPKEIDTSSSPFTVYLRKGITQQEQESGETTIKVWKYQEAQLTLAEYAEYLREMEEYNSIANKELRESNLILMEALADSFDQQLALQENQLIIMEAMADFYENMNKEE